MSNDRPKLICKVCGRTPEDILEYRMMADEEGITADDFCWNSEGTVNKETGKFYCTECYIKAGMPSGTA